MRVLMIFLCLLTFPVLSGTAQSAEEKAKIAIESGNAEALAKLFTANIDLAVDDVDDVYSKAQAEQVLKKFFAKNKPKSFKYVHQGESHKGIKYVIGELTTSSGKHRVAINIKTVSGKEYIHQLRIE